MSITENIEKNEAYIDGSSSGLYGYYLVNTDQTFIVKDLPCTNNQAEWMSLYTLILDLPEGWRGTVYSDSLLIVNQFKGIYQVKDPELKRLHDLCKFLAEKKNLQLDLTWIPREKNICGKKIEKELRKERKISWEEVNGKLYEQYMQF